jgi:hypothetical protein
MLLLMHRCRQLEYVVDKALENSLGDKRVRCTVESCSFKAPLRIYLMHGHGKVSYSNAGVDYAKLHDQRAQISMPLPPILAMADADGTNGPAATVREQLLQVYVQYFYVLCMHAVMSNSSDQVSASLFDIFTQFVRLCLLRNRLTVQQYKNSTVIYRYSLKHRRSFADVAR